MSMKQVLATGALAIGLLGGGAVIANATTNTTTSAVATATSSAATNTSSAAASSGSQAPQSGGQQGGDRGANPADTTITGTNADKATAAVVAANSGFKVTLVQQDPDGSYDVHGTLADGTAKMFNVTTDFKVSDNPGLGMVHQSGADSAASGSNAQSSSSTSSAASN